MESSIAEGRAPASPGRVPLKDRYGNVRAWALVDAEDLERVNAYGRWSLKVQKVGPGYACRRAARGEPVLYLHRVIVMGVEPGDAREVDHISRDTLDNRKSNLRLCTHAQNRQNTKRPRQLHVAASRRVVGQGTPQVEGAGQGRRAQPDHRALRRGRGGARGRRGAARTHALLDDLTAPRATIVSCGRRRTRAPAGIGPALTMSGSGV
jgi:hypothetical protein